MEKDLINKRRHFECFWLFEFVVENKSSLAKNVSRSIGLQNGSRYNFIKMLELFYKITRTDE